MNCQNTKKDLKVVISVGDESGIGPEIILKALCSNEISENIDFILVGSKKNLQNTYKHLKSLGIENLANPKDLRCKYVFSRFFFDPTNIKSIFFCISSEQRAFKIISGPIPDSSPTLKTIENLLFVFRKFIKSFKFLFLTIQIAIF